MLSREHCPAVDNYSDWGFGEMFTRSSTDTFAPDGFFDPEITDSLMRARCVEIEGPVKNLVINGNEFEHSALQSIDFQLASDDSLSDNYFSAVSIIGNRFSNCYTSAIDLSEFSGSYQDIEVTNNSFDLDPYFLRAESRSTNGTWGSSTTSVGVSASNVEGIKIKGNTFKNCSAGYIQGSANPKTEVSGNTFVGEPSDGVNSGTFSTSNKGVGLFPSELKNPDSTLFYVNSDPSSTSYGESFEQPEKSYSGSGAPRSSFYFSGQTLFARGYLESEGFVNLALKRVKSGTGNVIGTDWIEVKASV